MTHDRLSSTKDEIIYSVTPNQLSLQLRGKFPRKQEMIMATTATLASRSIEEMGVRRSLLEDLSQLTVILSFKRKSSTGDVTDPGSL